jgi:hypothetical protein
MNEAPVVLWRADDEHETTCVMISCCSGAELQMRRGTHIVLRELYPDKSTLFERARALRAELQLPIPPHHEPSGEPV